jgi:hypothetical protein
MARYDDSDLMFTDDGDIVINERGDFALVNKNEYVEQTSRDLLRTSDPDWQDYDVNITEIGANMEDLIGMPNNPDTAKMGIDRISAALTRYSLVNREDIFIKPVPLSRYIIMFFVFIKTPHEETPIGFQISFNLESGVTVRSA